ncbi:hypothetical protein DYBT9275_05185 [Dyadobacter sp. CECT 9275]|uniref:T9SS type A sorting domain-containing protein n=1 Tax=Dyadobacter helix TaxID=2822344 RepID=A0A916JHF1_9BACT|nr:sialate O-acetylesterase [Dyadobacter sp. CECT 9275]CAG5012482.1 hypothetical protein DYBT9275_05185 [Dyadobacter sp. CECT 9275]
MYNNFINQVVAKAFLLFCIIPSAVFSQIKITSPVPRAVYQQDATGKRTVTINGTFSIPVDKIEVRAVPVILGQGIETPWDVLQAAPKGGVFAGNITLAGGWYAVEIRAISAGTVVGRDVLERLGVGEVFIISGQSNAQGLKNYPGPSAVDDRVMYISNYNNDGVDRLTDPTPPEFAKITSDLSIMSPRGQSAWCWGTLGDQLVARLNVPVLFINTAWEGTSIENWALSSQGLPTKNKYGGFVYPDQMPYANLRIAARNYANQYGVRAILWMQGETDGLFGTPASTYRDHLQNIMNRLGNETGGKRITWVIARTSRTSENSQTPNRTFPNIIAAQNAVIDTPFNPTYPGPETDPLVPERLPDRTHFVGNEALKILANAWYNVLDARFFSTVTPLAPAPLPQISATCVTENNAVTITLPAGYASYQWNTGATGNSIRVTNAGTYRATVKDASGNSILTPVVVLENNAKPATPSIIQQGQQQACADSTFTFSVNGANDIFSWYEKTSNTLVATGAAAKIAESGSYYVQRSNIFGCTSEKSSDASLTIQPKIDKPVIESSGPFSITANISQQQLGEVFIWRRPGSDTDTTAKIIKILKTGTYSTKAKVVFTIGNNSLTCYSDTSARDFKTNEQNEVVIYPNPSQESYVYIESRDDIRNAVITMYDIFGREIFHKTIPLLKSRVDLPIEQLASGKYILKVVGEGQSLTKQVVIR